MVDPQPFSLDPVFHIADLLILAGLAWRVMRVTSRILDVMKYFPPHRHVNGSIDYPSGYEPGRSEKLKL